LASPTRLFTAMKETFDVGNDTLEADRDLRILQVSAQSINLPIKARTSLT
jgi:hypothetical protein